MPTKKKTAKKPASKVAKASVNTATINTSSIFDPKLLSSDIPPPRNYGGGHGDVRTSHPNEYNFIKNMEQGQSFPFPSESDVAKLILKIKVAIRKDDPSVGLVIKKVDDKSSRIWRDDNQVPRKRAKKRGKYKVTPQKEGPRTYGNRYGTGFTSEKDKKEKEQES